MARIEASVMINQPIDEVFAYVTDAGSWPKWESGLLEAEQTSEGPVGVGTRFRGTNQVLGLRMEWASEVMEYKPNRKWGQRITSGSWSTEESLTFEPVEDSSTITLVSVLELRGFFRLVVPILVRMMQKQIEGNLANLKGILEGQTDSST